MLTQHFLLHKLTFCLFVVGFSFARRNEHTSGSTFQNDSASKGSLYQSAHDDCLLRIAQPSTILPLQTKNKQRIVETCEQTSIDRSETFTVKEHEHIPPATNIIPASSQRYPPYMHSKKPATFLPYLP